MVERRLLQRYKLRLQRKRLLWRCFRKSGEFRAVVRRTGSIASDDVLLFATVRNEALRLPYFLMHYRKLGVRHFLIMDNGSEDETVALLRDQHDVSLWQTDASYKSARFGMDWLSALLWRYGHGHWTLTVDADELLIYPHWETYPLPELTDGLTRNGVDKLGALMLELYPKGPVAAQCYSPGQDPTEVAAWYDPHGYWVQRQSKLENLWLQGGPRARAFFAEAPHLAPTLNKVPLVRWRRPYVYVDSTHRALPVNLNHVYDTRDVEKPSAVLLHTKFLPDAPQRAVEERQRGEHFARADVYGSYYRTVAESPDLWTPQSSRYAGWEKLVVQGLMSRGGWPVI